MTAIGPPNDAQATLLRLKSTGVNKKLRRYLNSGLSDESRIRRIVETSEVGVTTRLQQVHFHPTLEKRNNLHSTVGGTPAGLLSWGVNWRVACHGRIIITGTTNDIFYRDHLLEKKKNFLSFTILPQVTVLTQRMIKGILSI
ncbi:hypothetical protein YC2023_064418 [Brassica napus]